MQSTLDLANQHLEPIAFYFIFCFSLLERNAFLGV